MDVVRARPQNGSLCPVKRWQPSRPSCPSRRSGTRVGLSAGLLRACWFRQSARMDQSAGGTARCASVSDYGCQHAIVAQKSCSRRRHQGGHRHMKSMGDIYSVRSLSATVHGSGRRPSRLPRKPQTLQSESAPEGSNAAAVRVPTDSVRSSPRRPRPKKPSTWAALGLHLRRFEAQVCERTHLFANQMYLALVDRRIGGSRARPKWTAFGRGRPWR